MLQLTDRYTAYTYGVPDTVPAAYMTDDETPLFALAFAPPFDCAIPFALAVAFAMA